VAGGSIKEEEEELDDRHLFLWWDGLYVKEKRGGGRLEVGRLSGGKKEG
jgi:hypothetical protein